MTGYSPGPVADNVQDELCEAYYDRIFNGKSKLPLDQRIVLTRLKARAPYYKMMAAHREWMKHKQEFEAAWYDYIEACKAAGFCPVCENAKPCRCIGWARK